MKGVPPALQAVLETGGALVRRSSTGRALLGRAAGLLEAEGYPRAMRGIPDVLDDARATASAALDGKAVKRAPGKLEREPLALTPWGAVYRGELDGEAVAVRIRRPGLETGVRNDLALLDLLGPALAPLFGALDTGAILRAIRERSLDELDFEHEAASQRAVARALRGLDGLRLPAVRTEDSAPDALVTEFVAGPTLAEAEPADAGAVARKLVQAHVRAARAGLAPVDARPNHVVLTDEGVVLLGAGNAAAVDRERAAGFLDALGALRDGDEDAFVAVVADRLALLPEAPARDAFALLGDLLAPFLDGPARLDQPALAQLGERTLARLGPLVALGAFVTPDPADLWLGRMAGQLVATLAWLGATEDWIEVALQT